MLIDAHSIRGVIPSLFDGRLPDLSFGIDSGRTLSPKRLQALNHWRDGCSAYSHVLDGRFRGGYTTRHYGDPTNGVESLQIEIVQDTYLDTAAPRLYDAGLAAPLSLTLRPLVEALLAAL
ncbi:MAG: N-formylglutamate amidohydrolase [Asticcacaulis sp.]